MRHKHFTVEGRRFDSDQQRFYEYKFGDFRIRLFVVIGDPLEWSAELVTLSSRHALDKTYGTPKTTARAALDYWKDEIAESDEAEAQDSERDRQGYVRDNRLRKDDVL